MAVARSPNGVLGITLPARTAESALDRLCEKTRTPPNVMHEMAESAFGTLPARLSAFIHGHRTDFPDSIDRRGWTGFRSRVWEATRHIPYGETRSYGWVAAAAGQPMAFRATGQALHHNPVPIIIPCHRVVGSRGSLTGFGSGLELKAILLALESKSVVSSANL